MDNKIEKKTQTSLSSVQNALKILSCFSFDETEKRLTQIANELNIAKSTASRLLNTLAQEGFVKKDKETQKYSLGTKILTLYGTLISNREVVKEARPILEELSAQTSESIQLGEIEGSNVIYVDRIKSTYPLQITSHIGLVYPLHCTSSGKLLLAFQKEEIINQILEEEFIKYTSSTITDSDVLYKQLEEIKKNGYCYIENEFIDGIISIAAPIRDFDSKVIASISLAGPIQRINSNKAQQSINKVIEAAKKISQKMGYYS